MRDVVYLHGFVERQHGQPGTATFIPFFADGIDPAHEEEVFRKAWAYLTARVQDSVIYYYSKYERTAYRKLATKFPAVCSVDQVNELFGLPVMIDLYFPPRQNSCRPDMIWNLGAIRMNDGSVRTSIQEQSGGAVAAAGERRSGRGGERDWSVGADIGTLA